MKFINELALLLFCIISITFLIRERKKSVNKEKRGSLEKIELTRRENEETKIDSFVRQHSKWLWAVLLILIFISRIYQFGKLPAYVGVDEAAAAYDGYALANFGVDRYLQSFPVYLTNFGGGQSVLYAYLSAGFMKILGTDLWVFRLPSLLLFILSILVGYQLVKKAKSEKMAFLFAFLLVIFPWHIMSSRYGLDCNLLFSMLIIDLYWLTCAKTLKGYILVGVMIGLTLYTYCLSYLIIPIFLIGYLGYALYLKKIQIKQILVLGIPIFLLALPLMTMLLVNNGILEPMQWGPFTITKLLEYRQNEIAISNIWNHGIETILRIFTSENILYAVEIPFFIIGILVAVKETIISIKEKKWSLDAVMLIVFIAVLFTMLLVEGVNSNKANAIYIPIIYYAASGILALCKKSMWLLIIAIGVFIMLFVNYMVYYYMQIAQYARSPYESRDLYEIAIWIEQEEQFKNANKYIITKDLSRPEIYFMLAQKVSPYVFAQTKQVQDYPLEGGNQMQMLQSYEKHYFDMNQEAFEQLEKGNQEMIFIIDQYYELLISLLQKKGLNTVQKRKFYDFISIKKRGNFK